MIIRMNIKPLLGHYKLQQLDRLTYEREYIAKLEGRNSPCTVRLRHSIFKIAINAAVENELIARNRFTKVKITEPDKYNNENINFLLPYTSSLLSTKDNTSEMSTGSRSYP